MVARGSCRARLCTAGAHFLHSIPMLSRSPPLSLAHPSTTLVSAALRQHRQWACRPAVRMGLLQPSVAFSSTDRSFGARRHAQEKADSLPHVTGVNKRLAGLEISQEGDGGAPSRFAIKVAHPSTNSEPAHNTTRVYVVDDGDGTGATRQRRPKWLHKLVGAESLIDHLRKAFLPENYPNSVTPTFLRYCQWQAAHMMFSTACGVLSTQSLLFAVGVGSGALPLAAGINWVVKDGIGQLGGVIYGYLFGEQFSNSPKLQRFRAVALLKVGGLIDIFLPLFPGLFLPLASVSTIVKNVSFLASSATRAQMHLTFAKESNLGDVTAKIGSQTVAASLAGTGLGVLLSNFSDASVSSLALLYAPLAVASVLMNYKSAFDVTLPFLNHERMLLFATMLIKRNPKKALPLPNEIAEVEGVARTNKPFSCPLKVNPPISSMTAAEHKLLMAHGVLGEGYFLSVVPTRRRWHHRPSTPSVILIVDSKASVIQLINAYVHAVSACHALEGSIKEIRMASSTSTASLLPTREVLEQARPDRPLVEADMPKEWDLAVTLRTLMPQTHSSVSMRLK